MSDTKSRRWRWSELDTSDYVLERIDEEEHDLNWKAFLEVYLEDYHISAVHPGFRVFVDPSDIRARSKPSVPIASSSSRFTFAGRFRQPRRRNLPTTRKCCSTSSPVVVHRCRHLDVSLLGPTGRVVSVHDGRDHVHAAFATAHAPSQRVLLRPRGRRNPS